jgi:hypothetical protein
MGVVVGCAGTTFFLALAEKKKLRFVGDVVRLRRFLLEP